MGLFDVFKTETAITLTPKVAFTASLLYMISADGQIEEEEIGQLLSVIGGDRNLLDSAIKFARKTPVDAFLPQAASLLSEQQKLGVLTNLCDSLLADGEAAPQEQALFARFLTAFNIGEERFRPYFDVIALKNNRRIYL